MFIDRGQIQQFPFDGSFYNYVIDESLPLDEQQEEEVLVLATKCDVQESNKILSPNITVAYNVFFPFDKTTGLDVKKGMRFRCNVYGLQVNGIVVSIFPTQFVSDDEADKVGGCVAYISDKDV